MTQDVKSTSLYKSYHLYKSTSHEVRSPLHKKTPKENNKAAVYGGVTAGMVAGAGILFLLLSKGVSRKIHGAIKRYTLHINEKLIQKNMDNVGQKTRSITKKAGDFLSYLQIVTNTSSIKDALAKKILPNWFNELSSALFKKSAINTVDNSYNEAFSQIDNFLKLARQHAGKHAGVIEQRTQAIKETMNSSFNRFQRMERINYTEEQLDGLNQKVLGEIWKATKNLEHKTLKNFVAQDLAQNAKDKINGEINAARKIITSNIPSLTENLNKLAGELKDSIILNNPKGYKNINEIQKLIKEFSKHKGANEALHRKETVNKIIEQLNILKNGENSQKYENTINEIINTIKNDKKGEIEEILTLLRETTDEKTYKKIIYPKAQAAIRALIKANKREGNDLFDKIRDIECGSASWDAVTLAAGFALTGAYMANTKSTEEFVSAGLQSGLPAVATLSSVFFATSKLLSGGIAIAFGMITGFVTNAFGVKVNGIAQAKLAQQKEMHKVYNMYKENSSSFKST